MFQTVQLQVQVRGINEQKAAVAEPEWQWKEKGGMKLIRQIIKVKKKTEEGFSNELFDKIRRGITRHGSEKQK